MNRKLKLNLLSSLKFIFVKARNFVVGIDESFDEVILVEEEEEEEKNKRDGDHQSNLAHDVDKERERDREWV